MIKMGNFDFTGFAMFAMSIYGIIALISEKIIFDWKMAIGIIVFVLAIEFFIYMIED